MTTKTATMQALMDLGVKVDADVTNATIKWVGEKKQAIWFGDCTLKDGTSFKKGDLKFWTDKKTGKQTPTMEIGILIGDGSITGTREDKEGVVYDKDAVFVKFGNIQWTPSVGELVDFHFKLVPNKDVTKDPYMNGSKLTPAKNAALKELRDAADKVLTACYNGFVAREDLATWKTIEAAHEAEFTLIWPPGED